MATKPEKHAKINLLSKATALTGVALFCLGLVWPMFETGADEWTPEQAAEYSSASRVLHRFASEGHAEEGHSEHDHAGHSHSTDTESEVEDLAQAKLRFESISQQLESVKAAPQIMAGRMKLIGGVFLLVGAATMSVSRVAA